MLHRLTTFSILASCAVITACGDASGPSPEPPPPPTNTTVWKQVVAGARHSCGIDEQGVAYCWGDNFFGSLGDGSSGIRESPGRVNTEVRFTRLSGGGLFTCGLTASGEVYCWGQNVVGQLGDGTTEIRSAPVRVQGLPSVASIQSTEVGTIALAADGTPYCWGLLCFDGGALAPIVPAPLPAFASVDGGSSHYCGIDKAGGSLCWGQPLASRLGPAPAGWDGELLRHSGMDLVQLAAGTWHSCGLDSQGQAVCWGDNRFGELGSGTFDTADPGYGNGGQPPQVVDGPGFTRIYAGGFVTCGLTAAQDAYCWGRNKYGFVGDGTRVDRAVPTLVSGGHKFVDLSIGGPYEDDRQHVCGITAAGRAYCWGSNLSGELGGGGSNFDGSPVPSEVLDPR